MDAQDDLALIGRVLERDGSALRALAERLGCVPRIIAVRNARLGRPLDDADIHDVAQEVIVKLWSRLREFRGEARLESWVFRFCEFELGNTVRRRQRQPVQIGGADTSIPDRTRTDRVDLERVYRGLDALPAEDARIVRQKHFDEKTFEEIARELAMPVPTVKSRYYRALQKLRRRLLPFAEEFES